MNNDNPFVEDAQIVEEKNDTDLAPQINTDVPQGVSDILRVEEAIKERLPRINKLKEEMQPHKEMIDSILDTNPKYVELAEIAKKANQAKSQLKKQLLDTPQAKLEVEKLKTLRDELKELQDGLSYYLREFQRLTGANEFEGEDGELKQIVSVVKLVRKSSK